MIMFSKGDVKSYLNLIVMDSLGMFIKSSLLLEQSHIWFDLATATEM